MLFTIFILDYGNDVRQKANLSNFLSEFKMGRKASETAHNISNTFGPGTANKHTVQQQFKKFCKGEESLQDGEQSGWPSEAGNDQFESHHRS